MQPPSRSRSPLPEHEHEHDQHESSGLLNHPNSHHDDDDGEEEGYSYPQGASIPQVVDRMEASGGAGDVVFDGDEELRRLGGGAGAAAREGEGQGEVVPYAHRDIKPAYAADFLDYCARKSLIVLDRNIMIDDNGEAILMDFGSTCRARIHVETRQQALTQQVCY